jgi:hypothetical protein
MSKIPFSHINWTSIEKVEYKGDKGFGKLFNIPDSEFDWLNIQGIILQIIGVKKDILCIA